LEECHLLRTVACAPVHLKREILHKSSELQLRELPVMRLSKDSLPAFPLPPSLPQLLLFILIWTGFRLLSFFFVVGFYLFLFLFFSDNKTSVIALVPLTNCIS